MNDDDIKKITNKFKQKYLRQDKVNLIRSLYVKSQCIASTSNTTFWWAVQTQTDWVIFEPAGTHHLCLKAQIFQKTVFTYGRFSLKAVYNSCKLQRLLKVSKFLFMYSFTRSNKVFFSGTYIIKLSSSLTFVTRGSVSVVIVFPFFRCRIC